MSAENEAEILKRLGGACALFAALVLLGGTILFISSDITEDPDDIGAYLKEAEDNTEYRAAIYTWFLLPVLLIPVVFAIHHHLREAGFMVDIARAASFVGLPLIVVGAALALGMVDQLAPDYNAAEVGGDAQYALGAVASTLLVGTSIVWNLGLFLVLGLGVLLFGTASLRTATLPPWAGWLGVATGAISFLFFMSTVLPELVEFASLGLVLFILWLAAVGVLLLREGEPAAEAEAEGE